MFKFQAVFTSALLGRADVSGPELICLESPVHFKGTKCREFTTMMGSVGKHSLNADTTNKYIISKY